MSLWKQILTAFIYQIYILIFFLTLKLTLYDKKPYNQGFSLLIHSYLSRLLPAKLHTRRDASAEKDPLAGLSSIRIPTLDRV